VFFYPKDDTPGAYTRVTDVRARTHPFCAAPAHCSGCTKEACSFRDSYQSFTDAGCEVVGISSDPPASHKAFAAKHRLPYTLLSDERAFVRNGFGVPSDLFGMLPGRQTYVIGKDGKCLMVFNSQLEAEKHVSEALAVIKKAAK
jgi:peroxiredoxin Q/BCP